MKFIIVTLASILFLSACYSVDHHTPVTIVPLKSLNRVEFDTSRVPPERMQIDNFLIKNYKDDQDMEQNLDSFVQKSIDSSALIGRFSYIMLFYKESKETNLESYRERKVVSTQTYKNDFVFAYKWNTTTGHTKEKFKDGNPIDTAAHQPRIELTDIDTTTTLR